MVIAIERINQKLYHMIMVANFENFLISPSFILDFRKNCSDSYIRSNLTKPHLLNSRNGQNLESM